MLKKLIGRWTGTFAAKSVAFKAATAVTAVTLAATPAVSHVIATNANTSPAQAVKEAVVETASVNESQGGVEGTKNMDELLDENGNLKGFVDVSDWTQEDLDKWNEAKKEAKKKAEQEMLDQAEDSWDNYWKNHPEDVDDSEKSEESAVVQNPSADTSEIPDAEPQPETSQPEVSQPEASDDKKNNDETDEEKKGPYDGEYARPGTVGPNGEKVGDIADMPGYNGDDGKTEEEKWQEKQDELDNADDNWDKYWENHPEDTTPVEKSKTEETTQTPDASPETDDTTTVTGNSSSEVSEKKQGLLGQDGNTHKALEEAFRQAQEELKRQEEANKQAETEASEQAESEVEADMIEFVKDDVTDFSKDTSLHIEE